MHESEAVPDAATMALLQESYRASEEGRLQEAAQLAQRAVDLAPRSAYAYQLLGWCYEALDEVDRARATYLAGLAQLPGQPDLLGYLGVLEGRAGDNAAAERAFRAALAHAPDNAKLHLDLARSLRFQQRFAEAVPYLERAYELAPAEPRILDLVGAMWVERGDPARAADCLFQALHLGHESIALHDTLCTALLQLDRGEEALLHAQRVYELEPTEENADQIKQIRQVLRDDAKGAPSASRDRSTSEE
jgi:Flp pilus assembly protein TadD